MRRKKGPRRSVGVRNEKRSAGEALKWALRDLAVEAGENGVFMTGMRYKAREVQGSVVN